jgi:hypothetical protein
MSEKEKMTREQVLERLDAGKRGFEGFDLSGLDLHGLDMHYITLFGADLRQASLRGADLAGANTASTDFWGATFTDAAGAKPVHKPDIEKGKAYATIKTGKVYTVLHSAAAARETAQGLAVYQDTEQGAVWVRSLTEFNEML